MPSRRDAERALEAVVDFPEPEVGLEQYLTPPSVAASIAHHAALTGDLERRIVDLGTGTGMLAIAAALYEAPAVTGLEVDRGALRVAHRNARRLEVTAEWVQGDVRSLPLSLESATVLANPPWGAQHGNRKADRDFLEAAASIGAVSYTVHNAGSLSTVEGVTERLGGTVTDALETTLPIDHRFDFHTAERTDQPAEVIRIEWD